jgi:hypothetical protein
MSVRCFWKIAQTWIMQPELCQVDDDHDDDGSCLVAERVRNELTATKTSVVQKKRQDRGA